MQSVFAQAADATEEILHSVFGIRIAKKKGDPLSSDGFMGFVRGLAIDLKKQVQNAEAQGLASALAALEVDWTKMTPKQRAAAVTAAEKAMASVAPKVSPKIKQKLLAEGQTIVEATKVATIGKYELSIPSALALGDEKQVQALAGMQSLYVTDEYGRRAGALGQTARVIVSSGLERGLDQYTIGEELRLAIGAQMPGRSEAYWDVVSSIFVARARTWGQLSSFHEAGIAAWEFVAVLDEDTSEICRLMDGKVFSVRGAKQRYEQVAESGDPEQVKLLQPFVQVGRDQEGNQILYYKQGEQRVQVARVDVSGDGQRDVRGTYSSSLGDQQLEAAGIGPPPLHGHCRSEMVPADIGSSVQVPRAPAPIPVAPPAPVSAPVFAPPKPLPPAPAPPPPMPVAVVSAPPPAPVTVFLPITPVSQGGLTAGVHVKEVVGAGITPERVGEIFAVIEDKGLLDYLAQNPLESIVLDPDRKGSGAYKYSTKQLTLKAKRETDSYGRKLKPGESFSISKTAKTELDAIQTTLIHELGHHVHNRGSNPKIDALIEKAFKDSPSAITKYGNTEPLEYFAESFAAYYKHPYALKKHDPIGYKMVEDVLVERGILERKPKKQKPTRAPAAPAPPPPPKKGDPLNILHEKVSEASGSNDGGVYRGADGVERYVKFYPDAAQAHCEHLANQIYRDLGFDAPNSEIFLHQGRYAYASEIMPGGQTLAQAGLTKQRADGVLRGFVGDVLTGNWDAVGTGLDNVLVMADGRLVRIDNGGTFLMRAKFGRKPEAVLNAISEWKALVDPNINEFYSQVARKAGVGSPVDMKDLVVGEIRKVLALRDGAGSWKDYVLARIPDAPLDDRNRIVAMLEARTGLLEGKLDELLAPPAPPPPKEVVFSADSELGKKVFRKVSEFRKKGGDADFYNKLYTDAQVGMSDVRRAQETISGWTSELRDGATHLNVYTTARAVIAGEAPLPSDDLHDTISSVAKTRATRWKAFFEAVGAPDAEAPTHLLTYRGLKGMDWVVDVAKSWEAGDSHINVRAHEVASWSMRRASAVEEFAGIIRNDDDGRDSATYSGDYSGGDAGVIHRWKARLDETLMDQVIDDATFLSGFYSEHEVIAGKGHDRGVDVDARDPEVYFQGKKYTYAERGDLVAALRRAGKLP